MTDESELLRVLLAGLSDDERSALADAISASPGDGRSRRRLHHIPPQQGVIPRPAAPSDSAVTGDGAADGGDAEGPRS